MWGIAAALFLLCDPVSACDAGVTWGEKTGAKLGVSSRAMGGRPNTANWPKAMRKRHAASKNVSDGDSWPHGADATSYSHTMSWKKMSPKEGGNVFISLMLDEGCGGGYIGAQMHADQNKMFTDWAIWDWDGYNNTVPLSKDCVRYDGEGHGTQCGVDVQGKMNFNWTMDVPYTWNVSLVMGNSSGAHFKATITNEATGEVIPAGEIWTGHPKGEKANCSRLLVGGGGFQECFSGGNFTNIAEVKGPIFRGVEGHPADVMPTNFTDCYMHNSCYAKTAKADCRNETTTHCLRPKCKIPTQTFMTGKVPIPDAMIPPWDHNPEIKPSNDCWFAETTGLNGGEEPAYWGMPIMDDKLSNDGQRRVCCGYCLADPKCVGVDLYGDRCSLRHNTSTSAPITFVKGAFATTAILPMRSTRVQPGQAPVLAVADAVVI